MNPRARIQLALHGTLVILAGLTAGIPYALVVTGAMAGEERAWRMAHGEGIQNGLVMLAVSGIGGSLVLDERRSAWCAWSLAAAGYGNVIASILGAATGNRGLAFSAPLANMVVYLLFVMAIVGVYSGLGLVVSGALAALKKDAEHIHLHPIGTPDAELTCTPVSALIGTLQRARATRARHTSPGRSNR